MLPAGPEVFHDAVGIAAGDADDAPSEIHRQAKVDSAFQKESVAVGDAPPRSPIPRLVLVWV